MTLLSPSSSSRRRGAMPVVVAVIGALAIGIGAGWFFAGRDKGTPAAAGPTNGVVVRPYIVVRFHAVPSANVTFSIAL